ncbi:Pecanex-like protein 1 [Actinoplanes philippinensis]|uniref:Pecanex-like protein 1 n=1 Tax=Actinoplanes philippinensis TaxID=35752 RepID=UPI0033CAE7E6
MRRSKYRRANSPAWFSGRRRIVVVAAAALAAFGGVVTVTQISSAGTKSQNNAGTNSALAACEKLQAPARSRLSTQTRKGTYTTNNGQVTQHADDGAGDVATTAQLQARCRDWVTKNVANQTNRGRGNGQGNNGGNNNGGNQGNNGGNNNGGNQGNNGGNNGGNASAAPSQAASSAPANNGGNNNGGNNNGGNNGGNQGNNGGNNNGGNNGGGAVTPPPGAGLGVLTNSCDTSNLEDHDGFQKGNRCVSTEFGEVGAAANNPTLLITNAPRQVNRNTPFTIQVSTRNLIRDRFLAAGQGGYYVESSVLQNGIVRGHFHTACRILDNRNAAPAPDPVPAFFVATEDRRGGAQPDTVAIQVPGLPQAGEFQCSSWAGDGSHRIPMMERANQTPAFDSIRVRVR